MILRQPLAQARQQQQLLLAITRQEVLRHTDIGLIAADRPDFDSRQAKRNAPDQSTRHRVPVTFDETIATLRQWIGQGVAVTLVHQKHGAADGYLADFSGPLSRVDEPIAGVDAPVFYFRWADGSAAPIVCARG